jgi:hypothetical protein
VIKSAVVLLRPAPCLLSWRSRAQIDGGLGHVDGTGEYIGASAALSLAAKR